MRSESARLELWAFCWASATLFSLVANPGWFGFLTGGDLSALWIEETVLALLAVATIVRPGSLPLVTLLALAQIGQVAILSPVVPNHRLILCLVNLAFLLAVAERGLGGGWARLRSAAILTRFLPTARAVAVLVYAFAFFAKLNRSFLDPASSCAVQFYGEVRRWLPSFPGGASVDVGVIWGTLVTEGLLAVLLVLPKLRRAGVILGLGFHVALSFDMAHHLVNFTSTMSALLVLFLPDAAFERLAGGSPARARAIRIAAISSFLTVIVLGFVAATGSRPGAVAYYLTRQALWLGYAAGLIGLSFMAPAASPGFRGARGWPSGLQAMVLFLVVLNGLSPYLGLKTRTTFSMYSNLDLRADGSNHLIVPRSLDLFGFLSDTVTVLETSDPALRSRIVETGSRLPFFEFSSYVNRPAPIEVQYLRGGERRVLDSASGTGMVSPPPWLLRKLLVFQPIGGIARSECFY